jgi:microcystin-dependent protein
MAGFGFFKAWFGLNIDPKDTSTADSLGDLEVDSNSEKLSFHNGTTLSPVVTEAHTATLTNKTIDADNNTITNIENADIKASAAIDATKIADGSVNNTEFQYINSLTSNAQDQLDDNAADILQVAADAATNLNNHITDATDAHAASAITNTPSGNISATTVQNAINELDSEKQPLDSTLTALAAYNTNGLITQTAADTFTGRTITGTANKITVTNGDGVSGNPTITIPDSASLGGSPTTTTQSASDNSTKIATTAYVETAVSTATGSVPGIILAYAGASAPTGYLMCDGSAVSRTTYASLYAAIGDAYGNGNGTTTFNVPDARGRFLRGVDGSAGNDPDKAARTASAAGGNTGNNVGSAQTDAFQGHWHAAHFVNNNDTGAGGTNMNHALFTNTDNNVVRAPISDGTNGTPRTTSETRPKNIYVNYIIKT